MAGCPGQELEAVFFLCQSGSLLNTPASALGASFKAFPQNPLDKHLLPKRNPQAEAEAGSRAPRIPSSWAILFACDCGAPEGDHVCTAGSAPSGHSPSPHPPQCCPSPGAPAGIPLPGPCRLPPRFCPFQLPRGGPAAGICRTRGSSRPVTDWKAASLGPAFPGLGSRPERAAGRPGAAAGSRPTAGS